MYHRLITLSASLLLVLAPEQSDGIAAEWRPVLQPDLFSAASNFAKGSSLFSVEPSLTSLVAQSYQHPGSLLDATALIGNGGVGGHCDLFKVGFTQDLYFQYIQYKITLPPLKELTLCHWSKFSNHSNDHPIFSYAVDGQPRAIYAWIANTDRSSYFSLAIEGHTLYRLNYPLRLNRWYHTCQSWNGRTGEWQIWVNGERVGRGFHNRLVGHSVPSGGIAITGQSQTQYGGGFLEGVGAPKGSGGILGEITMVQLYKVALTAGKAHRDHKHHHAHTFDHNGLPITTTPRPPTPSRPPAQTHPLITSGQLNPNIALSIASGQPAPQPQQIVPQQLLGGQQIFLQDSLDPAILTLTSQQQQLQQIPQAQPLIGELVNPTLVNPANVQYLDMQLETHQLFKRGNDNSTQNVEDDKKHTKRELYLQNGHLIDDGLAPSFKGQSLVFDRTFLDGLAAIGQNAPVIQQQKQNDEREPAEAEVRAVMNVCTGCEPEPFAKALIFGWRTVPKKLYSGAFYLLAAPRCKAF